MTEPAPSPVQNQRNVNVNRGALVVALLTLLLTALGFLGVGLRGIQDIRQARHWPTTTGTVFRSGVAERGDRYAPDVAYRYAVAGTEYQGTQLQLTLFQSETSDRAAVAARVARYPLGESVTVHYDPARPARSALEIPAQAPVWPLLLGAGMLLPFALLLWLWRRGYLNTLIQTGSVGKRWVWTPQTGVRVAEDSPPPPPTPLIGHVQDILRTGQFSAEWTSTGRHRNRTVQLLASLFLTVFMGGASVVAWQRYAAQNEAVRVARATWQTVSGRVVSSEVVSRGPNQYRPVVTYEYWVGGNVYRSSGLDLADDTWSTSNSQGVTKEVAAHGPGAAVTVHYDPADPQRSALELRDRGGSGWRLLGLITGGLALLCLLAALDALRR
ncbi:MAG: DUF3592 domain-containing protein [Deinococcus sp.]|uniref:DUF3592 domain-containing protein n=1 Tax=Deinococcus sp. TaxID=47478 RepID=UPI0026DD5180|nr:DUF3592 domain-containing protein [Deinococcus sp.]MDO4245984.1 DUF3592 domain-containing protein [Deinococcus sp.]